MERRDAILERWANEPNLNALTEENIATLWNKVQGIVSKEDWIFQTKNYNFRDHLFESVFWRKNKKTGELGKIKEPLLESFDVAELEKFTDFLLFAYVKHRKIDGSINVIEFRELINASFHDLPLRHSNAFKEWMKKIIKKNVDRFGNEMISTRTFENALKSLFDKDDDVKIEFFWFSTPLIETSKRELEKVEDF